MTDMTEPVLGRDPECVPVSNSEVGTFKDCRRKWWLGTYRGLQPKQTKAYGPLALGTRVHAGLEAYYTDLQDAVEVYTKLVEEDRRNLWANEQDTTDFDKEAELGRLMLEGYFQWLEETGADADLEVVGAEKKLSKKILDGRAELIGKVDARVRRKSDGVVLSMDHKTVATFDSITRTAHLSEQPKMYHLLEMLTLPEGERADGMLYNMLRKTKRSATARPPFYDRLEVHHNKKTMESFWFQLHGVVTEMLEARRRLDAGEDHRVVAYPRPTQDCTWKCPFFAVCPMFDDGSGAEDYIRHAYDQVNPLSRYDEENARQTAVVDVHVSNAQPTVN